MSSRILARDLDIQVVVNHFLYQLIVHELGATTLFSLSKRSQYKEKQMFHDQFSRKRLNSKTCTSPGKSVCGQPNLGSSCTSLVPRTKKAGGQGYLCTSLEQPVCGLQNLGNQCYMNATLQCLSHTHLLRDIFWNRKSHSPSSSLLASSGESSFASSDESRRKVIQAYAVLQIKMWPKQTQVVQPIEIRSAVASLDSRFAGYSQEDAQEFLTCLLDGLHEGMNRVKKKTYVSMSLENADSWNDEEIADELWRRHLIRNDSKIVEIFHGQIKSVMKCLKCEKEYKTFEPVSQLTLSIPIVHVSDTQDEVHVGGKECTSSNESVVDLDDCLNLYVRRKPLTWNCESCGISSHCVQKFDLWRLPQILIIHLKRFTVTGSYCCKVNTDVRFPDNLDLSKYLVSKHNIRPYNLYAVINHSGTLYAGHYTAYVKEENSWFHCNDEIVTQVRSVQTSNAYVLFYQQVS